MSATTCACWPTCQDEHFDESLGIKSWACPECGALVKDRLKHVAWHRRLMGHGR